MAAILKPRDCIFKWALEDFFEDAVAKHVNVKIVPISQQSEFEKQYPDTSELIRMDLLEEGMEEELL